MKTARLASVAACLALSAGALAQSVQPPAPRPKADPRALPEPRPEDVPGIAREAAKDGYSIEPFVQNVEVPWAIVWMPDGRMLFTERAGRVRIVEKDGRLHQEAVFTVEDVKSGRGEIGLMGIALHPKFDENKTVYLSYGSTEGDVRVVRYEMNTSGATPKLENPNVVLKGVPAGMNHAGCRIKFGPDGKLYVTTGEAFQRELAQDMTSLGGKTLRINDDGTAPSDNPFVGDEHKAKGVRPEIWTYGNRNSQGIDWQPGTGLLFESEHGPSGELGRGGDELNLLEKGRNYGWPVIQKEQTKDGMEPPLKEWTPAIAPASGAFYTGDHFPQWKGRFMIGALGGLTRTPTPGIFMIKLDGRNYAGEDVIATEYGRIREVAVGPDGYIYFSTSNKDGRARPKEGDDKIMRIVPKK